MIKPERLKNRDTVAVVSLSWGGLGDDKFIHKFNIAKDYLKNEFNLNLIAMPNALKGSKFLYEHPELRAKDWMDAFKNPTIKAIINIRFKNLGIDTYLNNTFKSKNEIIKIPIIISISGSINSLI